MTGTLDVLIIGAGMAGLTAARKLHHEGKRVLVVDKGRGVGGRMATRRIGDAVFDHGAQFMTVKDPSLARIVDTWKKDKLVAEWYRDPGTGRSVHPRYRGQPSMTVMAKDLAQDLNVLSHMTVVSVGYADGRWKILIDDGEELAASALMLTPPVPQSLALLDAGDVTLNASVRQRLDAIQYESCIAVMAVLGKPSALEPAGALLLDKGPIAWIADNQQKGISPVPAVTVHASPEFSEDNWERDRMEVGEGLLREAKDFLGSDVREFQVHGWRFSKPKEVDGDRCLLAIDHPPLVLAGDAFGGPRIEGAFLSGQAAADALIALS